MREHGERDHVVDEADPEQRSGTPRSGRGSGARGRRSTSRSRCRSRDGSGRARRRAGARRRSRSRARRRTARAARAPSAARKPGLSPMNRNASTNVCRLAASASVMRRPSRPRREARRSATSNSVAGERQRDRERAGRVDLGLERCRLLQREEDRVAETRRAGGTRRSSRSRSSRRRRRAGRR